VAPRQVIAPGPSDLAVSAVEVAVKMAMASVEVPVAAMESATMSAMESATMSAMESAAMSAMEPATMSTVEPATMSTVEATVLREGRAREGQASQQQQHQLQLFHNHPWFFPRQLSLPIPFRRFP